MDKTYLILLILMLYSPFLWHTEHMQTYIKPILEVMEEWYEETYEYVIEIDPYEILDQQILVFQNMVKKISITNKFDLEMMDEGSLDSQGLILPINDDHCIHNFASSSAGAIFVEAPPDSRDMINNLLVHSKDKYLLVPCTSKKEYVVSLSEEIVIEKFMLLNSEEFSSNIEMFSLYGASSYPTDHWDKLDTFLAKDVIGEWQSFPVKKTWLRYLKFSWKTSYESQYYCTLTQIKVCGRTMVQGLKDDLESIQMQEHKPDSEPDIEIEPIFRSPIVDDNVIHTPEPNLFVGGPSSEYEIDDLLKVYEEPEKDEYVIEHIDMCSMPSIYMHLRKLCSKNYQVEIKHKVDKKPKANKLNEIFMTIFQNFDQKLAQLSVKVERTLLDTRALQSRMNVIERRFEEIENAHILLSNRIQNIKDKTDDQEENMELLLSLSYAIFISIIVLIIVVIICVICPYVSNFGRSNTDYSQEVVSNKHVSSENFKEDCKDLPTIQEDVLVNKYESDNDKNSAENLDYIKLDFTEKPKVKNKKKKGRKGRNFSFKFGGKTPLHRQTSYF